MFFDKIEEIPKLVEKIGCAIFVVPNNTEIPIKNATIIEKGSASSISVDQIREVISRAGSKQKTAQYIIVKQADLMNPAAANAFLKNLEEPKENYHYVLQTEKLSRILPTIISRSEVFILKHNNPLDEGINASEEIKNIAKRLIVAKEKDYLDIMNEITKKKDNVREFALDILQAAIEMSYKSFFKTNNQIFLKKIPNMIKTYENIAANGHIKLHLVADML